MQSSSTPSGYRQTSHLEPPARTLRPWLPSPQPGASAREGGGEVFRNHHAPVGDPSAKYAMKPIKENPYIYLICIIIFTCTKNIQRNIKKWVLFIIIKIYTKKDNF